VCGGGGKKKRKEKEMLYGFEKVRKILILTPILCK
jgi:hypothetical protein